MPRGARSSDRPGHHGIVRVKDTSNLPLTCAHWGVYRVETRDGKVAALHGFEEDGDPSPIGQGFVGTLDDPTRITRPAVRKSWLDRGPGANPEGRGVEPFVEVDWDTAETLVAGELERVRKQHGNRAIFAGSYGWASAGRFHHAQSQLRRFLNCIGGFTRSVNTYSLAAAEVVMPHVLGNFQFLLDQTTSWQAIQSHTDLFVAFGGVRLDNSQINAGGVGSHCQREGLESSIKAGVKFVNLGPMRSDLEGEAEWLPIRPGTDIAAMLGIAHSLIEAGACDQEFLGRYTVGYGKFRAYVNGEADGEPKSAEWASGICGLPADRIRDLAKRMAASRTMISVSWSLTRQDHGEQPYWGAVALAAMLGQIGLPGGGVGFGYGAINAVGGHFAPIRGGSIPRGTSPVRDFIPVARISDMLLNPGGRFEYNGGSYSYPDIELVYWVGGNPFHHHQDLNRLLRAWRKPGTVIVHDWCWNALAKRADIVLPCTTALEREDVSVARDSYIIRMRKAVEPPAGCRNDHDIFRSLADRFGVLEEFTDGLDEEGWIRRIHAETVARSAQKGVELPGFDELAEKGWHRAEPPAESGSLLGKFREDPVGNPLRTPSGKIEIHSETVAGFGYEDCPGHPVWIEPAEWLGSKDRQYPLHLLSNQPKSKLHSQLDHGPVSRSSKIRGREPAMFNPADASARGITPNSIVRLFNDRGSCLCAAEISENVMPGVVRMSTGAWLDPADPDAPGSICKHGNPNVLTLDKGTSKLAQGPIAHTCLVEAELLGGGPPAITAFEPPLILRRFETGRKAA